MTYKNHLIVFSKTPAYGAVKKRLASEVGMMDAFMIYNKLLFKNLRSLSADPRWECWLALTEKNAKIRKNFKKKYYQIYQGKGDLGQKMKNCLLSVPSGNVVLIGADIPNLSRKEIALAFNKLKFNDLVFGPANDGGFWLIGVKGSFQKRLKNTYGLFDSVRWSSEYTLIDTFKNIKNKKIFKIKSLNDIDTQEDFIKEKLNLNNFF